MIRFEIPLAPVALERARRAKNGHWYTPPKSTTYKIQVSEWLRIKYPNHEPLDGPIEVFVDFYIERPKTVRRLYPSVKPDLDNYVKAIDAMTGILWVDDAQIVILHAEKSYCDCPPKTVILIRELSRE